MTSLWRRVGAVTFSLVVPLVGCSESDVTFPPADAADEAADTAPDLTPRPDTGATPDTRDAGVDVCACPDVVVADARDTNTPETPAPEAGHDGAPDVPEDDTIDGGPIVDDATDVVVGEPTVDADDGSSDAVSEEAGTCGSHCASGVCDMNGNCTPCVKDDECTGGRVCNAGTCGPRCGDGGVTCTGNLVCCSEHCVDTTRDPQHCGACGTTCPATQFCGNASTPACKDNVLRNLCNTKKATFLLNGLPDDDASSLVLRSAIATLCVPTPVLTSVDQSASVAINTTTGQPLVGGGEMLVAAGGDSTQLLVEYLESSRTSTVYNESDGSTVLEFKRRGGAADGGDAVLVTVPLSTISATHDFFLAEVIKDPISGTFSLIVYGIDSPGTRAGAFYFANVILPNIVGADVTTITQAWYLYEWTSANAADAGPSMGDTFTQIAAGL